MDGTLDFNKSKRINLEQIRQIERHKWIESEKNHRDMGVEAILDWVNKYAKAFREWAEKIPFNCIKCGRCKVMNKKKECPTPFDEERLMHLK